MVKSVIVAAVAAFAPVAMAQLAGLPQCAVNPAVAILNSSPCGLSNFECICKDSALLSRLQGAVQAACTDPADISTGIAAASALCAPYGGAAIAGADAATAATTAPTAAAESRIAGSDTTATADISLSTSITSIPYVAGNSSTTYASTGSISSNRTATGSPIVTGAATKGAAAPAIREAGLMAGMIAVLGAVAMI